MLHIITSYYFRGRRIGNHVFKQWIAFRFSVLPFSSNTSCSEPSLHPDWRMQYCADCRCTWLFSFRLSPQKYHLYLFSPQKYYFLGYALGLDPSAYRTRAVADGENTKENNTPEEETISFEQCEPFRAECPLTDCKSEIVVRAALSTTVRTSSLESRCKENA